MKLSRKEAQLLIAEACTTHPLPDALDRVLAHDWTFDPRGQRITLALRRYHEQDQVLYGTWSDSIRIDTYPRPDSPFKEMCSLCASTIASAPYFTANNFTGRRWEICFACASAMGLPDASPSGLISPQGALDRFHAFADRALAALRRTLRRFFG